jgi:hypothetical protein
VYALNLVLIIIDYDEVCLASSFILLIVPAVLQCADKKSC